MKGKDTDTACHPALPNIKKTPKGEKKRPGGEDERKVQESSGGGRCLTLSFM